MATTPRPRVLPSGKISWRVQFRVDGRVTSESFTDSREAAKFAKLVDRVGGDAAQRTRDARDVGHREIPTLEEWTRQYLDPKSGHLSGVTPATRAGYLQIAERSFLQVLGEMPLDVITRREVTKWVVWQEAQPSRYRVGQPISAKTVRNYHGVLSAVMAAAVEDRLIDGNPARGTKLTKGRREGVTFLTQEEFTAIYEHVPAYYQPLAYLLVWTGMRWGEATALTWADVIRNPGAEMIRINKAWKKGVGGKPVLGPPKTERSNRTITIRQEVLKRLGPPGRPGDLVFTGIRSGERMWSERFHKAAWQPAIARANVGKQPRVHDLRHTHASWLIARGVPLTYIQLRLGHENITTTSDIYGHLLPDANAQLVNVMDQIAADGEQVALPPAEAAIRAALEDDEDAA